MAMACRREGAAGHLAGWLSLMRYRGARAIRFPSISSPTRRGNVASSRLFSKGFSANVVSLCRI